MLTVPELEIAVLVLGMAILLVEAFATKIDKRVLAFVGIAGLTLVLVASFFVAPVHRPVKQPASGASIPQIACRFSSSDSRWLPQSSC